MAVSTLSGILREPCTSPCDVAATTLQSSASDITRLFILGEQGSYLEDLATTLKKQHTDFHISCVEPDREGMKKMAMALRELIKHFCLAPATKDCFSTP